MFSWNQMIVVDSESNSDWRIEDAELEDWLPELIRLHIWTYNCGRAAEKMKNNTFDSIFFQKLVSKTPFSTLFPSIKWPKYLKIFPAGGKKVDFLRRTSQHGAQVNIRNPKTEARSDAEQVELCARP